MDKNDDPLGLVGGTPAEKAAAIKKFKEAVSEHELKRSSKISRDGCLLHLAWIALAALFLLWGYSCAGWK